MHCLMKSSGEEYPGLRGAGCSLYVVSCDSEFRLIVHSHAMHIFGKDNTSRVHLLNIS